MAFPDLFYAANVPNRIADAADGNNLTARLAALADDRAVVQTAFAATVGRPPTAAPAHIAKPKGHLHTFVLDKTSTRLYAAGLGGFQVWQLRKG